MCCRGANPPLTAKRKKILADYMQAQKTSTANMFVDESYSHPAADADEFCALFDKATGKCSVHTVKPETCRAGPVTFDINLKTGKVEFYLKKGEICAFAGILYEDKASLKHHLEAAREEILGLIRDLDATALKAILQIPEPQTFKIAENELPKEVAEKLLS